MDARVRTGLRVKALGLATEARHQFRMQFGRQTNLRCRENRGISTMWIQSLKEGWGNCMRNLGEGYCPGEGVLPEVSECQGLLGGRVSECKGFLGGSGSCRNRSYKPTARVALPGFRVLELCVVWDRGIE